MVRPKAGLVICVMLLIAGLPLSSTSVMAQVVSAPSAVAPMRVKATGAQFRVNPETDQAWARSQNIRWDGLDVDALLADDAVRDRTPGLPKRVGVTRSVPGGSLTPATAGTWETMADGSAVWLLRLSAAGAKAVRIHFSRFDLEDGAELRLRGVMDPVDIYRGKGPNDDATFWAAPTPGDVAYLEYVHPQGKRNAVLEIDSISHFYKDPGFLTPPQALPNVPEDPEGLLSCHQSVMCHEVDTDARDAVGLMFFDGGFTCSGALLNDVDANTFAGYFLTANHCISSQSSANSLTVYWFYQQNSCGGAVPPLSLRPKSIGAKLLANSSLSDFSFMRFNNDPEDGQTFAAWTTAIPSGTVHGIHHPGGSWKRYALGVTTTSQPICGSLPTSRFVYNDWTPNMGVTEGGSSGSPLFNANFEVVGQLYGVCCSQACSSINVCTQHSLYNNVYGRFSQSYNSFSSHLNMVTPDDAYESNDSTAEAPELEEGSHALRLVDYDDYFKISFGAGADVTLTATFLTTDMDLDLSFLDENGAVLASSATTTGTETIVLSVPAGIYYVRAAKDNGWGGNYTLNFSAFLSECPPPTTAAVEPDGFLKNRFISFVPDNPGVQTAIRVTLVSLQRPDPPNQSAPPPDFSAFEGEVRWVGPPSDFTESEAPPTIFRAAQLQCEPYFADWGTVGLLHVFGPEVMPSSEYEVASISPDCDSLNETNYSLALVVRTGIWGDVVPPIQEPSPAARSQPDISDVSGIVDKFRSAPTAPIVARAMMQPNVVDPNVPVSFSDISSCVDSFRGVAYPFAGPTACP